MPGLPNYLLYGLVLLVGLQFTLSRLVPGRWLYATGSNAAAARLVGVPTRLVTFSAYLMSGLLAAFAGILSTSYLANAQSTAGAGLEIPASNWPTSGRRRHAASARSSSDRSARTAPRRS